MHCLVVVSLILLLVSVTNTPIPYEFRFPDIVVGFSDKHTHTLRIWNPVTKRHMIRGPIKYLGHQPQPTVTYNYSPVHFPTSEDPTLSLSIQSPNMEPPYAELGGTSAVPPQLISDSFRGTEATFGGTDGESDDVALENILSISASPFMTLL